MLAATVEADELAARARGTQRAPAWARWRSSGRRYTLGIEEEVMLLDPSDQSLAEAGDTVIEVLSEELVGHVSRETHAAVLELSTGINDCVGDAVTELGQLRAQFRRELRHRGLTAASAGTYPLAHPRRTKTSAARRYRAVAETMRFLANREPTMALHVHVGVPDPQDAVSVLGRLRWAVPLLLALSANSPYPQGHESGFASARTAIFGGFPRTGPPPAFESYNGYVDAIDPLIASGALPDPTFLWWDVRLQPALGTVEVRVMDAQSSIAETAPLAALIQSLTRLELEGRPPAPRIGAEVLAENRFLAARDGLDARLVDPEDGELVPVRALVDDLVRQCLPHAAALGCAEELLEVRRLATANGSDRQRRWIQAGGGLASLLSRLEAQFVPGNELVPVDPQMERSD